MIDLIKSMWKDRNRSRPELVTYELDRSATFPKGRFAYSLAKGCFTKYPLIPADDVTHQSSGLVSLGYAKKQFRYNSNSLVASYDSNDTFSSLQPQVNTFLFSDGELRLYELSEWNQADAERSDGQPDVWINYGDVNSALGINHFPVLAADGYITEALREVRYGDLGEDWDFEGDLEFVSEELHEGRRCARVRSYSTDRKVFVEYWVDLDPQRKGAVLRARFHFNASPKPKIEFNIAYKDVGESDWRPAYWSEATMDSDGSVRDFKEFHVSRFSKGADWTLFDVALKPGHLVHDSAKRGNESKLVVGDDGRFVSRVK